MLNLLLALCNCGKGLGVNCMHSVISYGFLKVVAGVLLDLLREVSLAGCLAVWKEGS